MFLYKNSQINSLDSSDWEGKYQISVDDSLLVYWSKEVKGQFQMLGNISDRYKGNEYSYYHL